MKQIVLAAAAFLPLPALAGVSSDLAAIDRKLKACIAKDETTMGVDGCNGDAYAAADKILTTVYRDGVDRFKHTAPDGRPADDREKLDRLIASERAWVAFKETDCKLQSTTMLGGSGEVLVAGGCLYSMTRDRAKSLDDLLSSD